MLGCARGLHLCNRIDCMINEDYITEIEPDQENVAPVAKGTEHGCFGHISCGFFSLFFHICTVCLS